MTLAQAGVSLIDCDHRTPPASDAGYPYVAIPQLVDGHIDFSSARRISREHLVEWTKKLKPQQHDVVIIRRCNSGVSAVVPKGVEFAIGQNLVVLRADGKRVHPQFLRWLVRGYEWWEQVRKYMNVGAVFDSLKCRDIPNFELLIADLNEQERIFEVLDALDDRIDLLRQTNTTLESIAQVLFKSWFIDFDSVRAKQAGREPEGMDTATAALFPAEFEESALGLIPKGWSVRSLDSLATYLNGLALQKFPPESDDEFLPVIKIAQLRAGNTVGADRASARLKPEYIVHDGDVLFSWSGSLEVEFWCGGDGALNQHLFKVSSAEVPKWFYYLATRHFLHDFREIAAHKATTMGHIQRKHLTEARLAVPPASMLRVFGQLIGPLLDRRIANSLQARELAALRDTLLPRLISGKLCLPEVKEQLEEIPA